jgi:hypothetical protein
VPKRSKQPYQETDNQKKRRAGNNAANRKLKRLGRIKKGDGKDVHHKDGNPLNNALSNLSVKKRGENRAMKPKKKKAAARDHKWIASKAKHLMSKEGKSQKAAFAQAYSMEKERRG